MTKPRSVASTANDNSIPGSRIEDGTIATEKLTNASFPPEPGSVDDSAVSSDAAISSSKLQFIRPASLSPARPASEYPRSVEDKLEDYVSVLDYIPEELHDDIRSRTHQGDLSEYVQKAVNQFPNNDLWKGVFFPAGTYYFNVFMGNSVILGDGSTNTIIKPFDSAQAAITVVQSIPYWNACKEFRNVGFGGTSKTGVGVAVGITNPLAIDYGAGFNANNPGGAPGTLGVYIQYAQSVKFYGCRFSDLERGISWTAGNIGSEMYSCSWSGCKYGLYLLNNKCGGDGMQAGCKYLHGGEISGCDVAIYMHNEGITNGNIILRDFVIEFCGIAGYFYNTGGWYCPIEISGLWDEANGQYYTQDVYGGTTVTIDSWSGNASTLVRGSQTITARSWVFDGDDCRVTFKSSIVGDMRLTGPNMRVDIESSRVEGTSGCAFMGPLVVDNPAESGIFIRDCWTDCGVGQVPGIYAENLEMAMRTDDGGNQARSTVHYVGAPKRAFITGGYSSNRVVSYNFTTSQSLGGGSFNLTGSTVSDGILYSICNEFTRNNFGSLEFVALTGSSFTTSTGWYICTFTAKNVSGLVKYHIWDRNQNQWFTYANAPNSAGEWVTYASMGYSPGGQTMFFDLSGDDGDCTWRMTDLQVLRFSLKYDAVNYLKSLAFSN